MTAPVISGDPITRSYGPHPDHKILTITTVVDRQGVSLTVTHGPNYSGVLSRTFAHADHVDAPAAARAWYAHLRDAARASTPVAQIETATSALIAAAVAAGL